MEKLPVTLKHTSSRAVDAYVVANRAGHKAAAWMELLKTKKQMPFQQYFNKFAWKQFRKLSSDQKQELMLQGLARTGGSKFRLSSGVYASAPALVDDLTGQDLLKVGRSLTRAKVRLRRHFHGRLGKAVVNMAAKSLQQGKVTVNLKKLLTIGGKLAGMTYGKLKDLLNCPDISYRSWKAADFDPNKKPGRPVGSVRHGMEFLKEPLDYKN